MNDVKALKILLLLLLLEPSLGISLTSISIHSLALHISHELLISKNHPPCSAHSLNHNGNDSDNKTGDSRDSDDVNEPPFYARLR